LVESENGHDTSFLKQGKIQEAVEGELNKDRWVALEKQDGSTEILTKNDIPDEAKPKPSEDWQNMFSKPTTPTPAVMSQPIKRVKSATTGKSREWASKFKKVKSATAVKKAKGG
jgi:putative sterol carrier protein